MQLSSPAVELHPYRGSMGKGRGLTFSPCQVHWGDLPLALPLSCSELAVQRAACPRGLPLQGRAESRSRCRLCG